MNITIKILTVFLRKIMMSPVTPQNLHLNIDLFTGKKNRINLTLGAEWTNSNSS